MNTQNVRIEAGLLRRLAVAADVDPRTVRRELIKPGSVRGMAGERLRAALSKRDENQRV